MSIPGTRVVRTEDPLFLTVGPTYTDDLHDERLTGALHAASVPMTAGSGSMSSATSSAASSQRVAPVPLEARATAAAYGDDGRFTIWCINQNAQGAKAQIAG